MKTLLEFLFGASWRTTLFGGITMIAAFITQFPDLVGAVLAPETAKIVFAAAALISGFIAFAKAKDAGVTGGAVDNGQVVQRIVKVSLALAIPAFLLSACMTDPATGKKTLTPAAQAELQAAGNMAVQAITNAAVIGAQNALGQWQSTGQVDINQLASAEIYGFAANAQGYIGQLVPRQTLTQAVGTPQVASAVFATLPPQVVVTQAAVDALQAHAASLAPK